MKGTRFKPPVLARWSKTLALASILFGLTVGSIWYHRDGAGYRGVNPAVPTLYYNYISHPPLSTFPSFGPFAAFHEYASPSGSVFLWTAEWMARPGEGAPRSRCLIGGRSRLFGIWFRSFEVGVWEPSYVDGVTGARLDPTEEQRAGYAMAWKKDPRVAGLPMNQTYFRVRPTMVMDALGLVVAVATCVSVVQSVRRVRRPGTCSACGYDLTGIPSSQCPECGTDHRTNGRVVRQRSEA